MSENHFGARSARDRILIAVEATVGVSALVCGLILPWNSLGMSEELLDDSPFSSFAVPGLILAIVVGGSLILSAAAVLKNCSYGGVSSFVAGSILLGWILVESWIVKDGRPLQLIVFVAALVTMALASREMRVRRSIRRSARRLLQF